MLDIENKSYDNDSLITHIKLYIFYIPILFCLLHLSFRPLLNFNWWLYISPLHVDKRCFILYPVILLILSIVNRLECITYMYKNKI